MSDKMSIAQISELYRQLGIDPVAAERMGFKDLVPNKATKNPSTEPAQTAITYAQFSGKIIADAELERNPC